MRISDWSSDVCSSDLAGAMMPDGSWAHILTIHDAIAGGMGKFLDLEEIRQECSDEEFANLYDCEETDDTASSFPWSFIASPRVDSFYTWKDFKAAELRSEEQTSELQSLLHNSSAVFRSKKQ